MMINWWEIRNPSGNIEDTIRNFLHKLTEFMPQNIHEGDVRYAIALQIPLLMNVDENILQVIKQIALDSGLRVKSISYEDGKLIISTT